MVPILPAAQHRKVTKSKCTTIGRQVVVRTPTIRQFQGHQLHQKVALAMGKCVLLVTAELS